MITLRPHLRDEWLLLETADSLYGSELSPDQAERLAIQAAYRGSGFVSPNPPVGAVILDKARRLIGVGGHLKNGEAHAEVNAMDDATRRGFTERLKGATLYCTLEPCAHQGKTPSCAKAIGPSGIKTVVVGIRDPNPLVDGMGLSLLENAGCQVLRYSEAGQNECLILAESFLHFIRNASPFVGLKVATSLNGVMARAGDQRNFMTSARARQYGHFLRLRYDGILIGAETLIQDNPTLDVRGPFPRKRVPERIVLDPSLRGFLSNRNPNILATNSERTTWICSTEAKPSDMSELVQRGAKVIAVPPLAGGQFDPAEILTTLRGIGLQSLLLEGGAGLYRAFLEGGFINRVHCFTAFTVQGGLGCLTWGTGDGQAFDRTLRKAEVTPIENEMLIEGLI